eukprot:Gregarina_sp_Poly_1__5649@NODE_297_length_9827_cov_119_211168_g245_i1_p9_GENE_NODE_297_length_9827_cov_119_211168_g245_i1NODE_297_length_9827_cov_119_211168_g245_i1_p9_ORF_typecomplete_len144_score13_77Integrase_H2C2/PF17921_1/4_3e03Integrase_H2C2/PF17921_1/4_4e05zfH2C2/PF09337_10/0_0079DUF2939/PF11159_8/52DUF2939/PF11159_8/3_8_NODE_297_length_9827_cov_119_211168_g245_i173177748
MSAEKGKIARWAALLAEYDCEIQYRRGPEMAHVDYLSRHLDWDELSQLLADKISIQQFGITEEMPILQPSEEPNPNRMADVALHEIQNASRLHDTAQLRHRILHQTHLAHDQHFGRRKMHRIISRTFWWLVSDQKVDMSDGKA